MADAAVAADSTSPPSQFIERSAGCRRGVGLQMLAKFEVAIYGLHAARPRSLSGAVYYSKDPKYFFSESPTKPFTIESPDESY